QMSQLVAYVDGGCHGSPGPSGIGVVIENSDGEIVKIAKWIGHQDNNVAEYVALLEALQHAVDVKAKALHVFSDSELVTDPFGDLDDFAVGIFDYYANSRGS